MKFLVLRSCNPSSPLMMTLLQHLSAFNSALVPKLMTAFIILPFFLLEIEQIPNSLTVVSLQHLRAVNSTKISDLL